MMYCVRYETPNENIVLPIACRLWGRFGVLVSMVSYRRIALTGTELMLYM